ITIHSRTSLAKICQYSAPGNAPSPTTTPTASTHPATATATHVARNRVQFHGARSRPHPGPTLVKSKNAGTPTHTEYTREIPKDRASSTMDKLGPFRSIATTMEAAEIIMKRSRNPRRRFTGIDFRLLIAHSDYHLTWQPVHRVCLESSFPV